MNKCTCCGKENERVKCYKLPIIGYGSQFDVVDESDITYFELCPKCAVKINRYIKKKLPEVSLEEFWKCNIVEVPWGENEQFKSEVFQYEDVLIKVFKRYMPNAWSKKYAKSLKGRMYNFINSL